MKIFSFSCILTFLMLTLSTRGDISQCEDFIETNAHLLPRVDGSTTTQCVFRSVTSNNTDYCSGVCQGQGQSQFEGQACILIGFNTETSKTRQQSYDCVHHAAMERYYRILTAFDSFIFFDESTIHQQTLYGFDIKGAAKSLPTLATPGIHGDVFYHSKQIKQITLAPNSARCYGDVMLCNQGLTVAMWIRMRFHWYGNDVWSSIIRAAGSGGTGYLIRVKRDGTLSCETRTTGRRWNVMHAFPMTYEWLHLVVTWSPIDDYIRAYYDGVLEIAAGGGATSKSQVVTEVIVGKGIGDFLDLVLDELVWIERALSEDEVKELYGLFA